MFILFIKIIKMYVLLFVDLYVIIAFYYFTLINYFRIIFIVNYLFMFVNFNVALWSRVTIRAIFPGLVLARISILLSRYFDVTPWSFCAALLQVKHTWCHRPSPIADRHHYVEPASRSPPPAIRRIPIPCSKRKLWECLNRETIRAFFTDASWPGFLLPKISRIGLCLCADRSCVTSVTYVFETLSRYFESKQYRNPG